MLPFNYLQEKPVSREDFREGHLLVQYWEGVSLEFYNLERLKQEELTSQVTQFAVEFFQPEDAKTYLDKAQNRQGKPLVDTYGLKICYSPFDAEENLFLFKTLPKVNEKNRKVPTLSRYAVLHSLYQIPHKRICFLKPPKKEAKK